MARPPRSASLPSPHAVVTAFDHTDHLGSATSITRTNRTKVNQGNAGIDTIRSAYGRIIMGSEPNGPGYAGHLGDRASDLTYMKARYYDNVAMRFVSPDPVDVDAATGANFNRYWYARNNPYTNIDRDGRESGAAFRVVNNATNGGDVGSPPPSPNDWLGPAIGVSLTVVSAPAVAAAAPVAITAMMAAPATTMSVGLGALEVGAAVATGTQTPGSVVATEANITRALVSSEMQTTQKAVSLPVVQRYIDKLVSGSAAPAIKAEGKVIVEGNHRYVAGRLVGSEPAVQPGVLSSSQASQVQAIQKIKVDPTDWGNE